MNAEYTSPTVYPQEGGGTVHVHEIHQYNYHRFCNATVYMYVQLTLLQHRLCPLGTHWPISQVILGGVWDGDCQVITPNVNPHRLVDVIKI